MKKIIIVDAGIGRTGSSAMMGLLNVMGVNLGGRHSEFRGPNPLNKKGYFELKSMEHFFKDNFSECFHSIKHPTVQYLNSKAIQHKVNFEELLHKEFGTTFPIGFKLGKGLLYPILNLYPEVYSLVMHRNLKNQVASILRMWRSAGQSIRKRGWPISEEFITELCQKWHACSQVLRQTYTNVHYKTVEFSELIEHPLKVVNDVSQFLSIDYPDKAAVNEWIDPSLVHST